jgi:uncharacterized Zn finger protein
MSKNWWGTAWHEKMEKLAESSRFLQGVGCVNGNRVPRCFLEGRTVVATVLDAGDARCIVRITFDAFTREQWDQLFANVRDLRALAKALSARDLPLEIQTAFSKAKLRFMPERFADLHLECGCADWLKPCRHLVAAWLKFGRDFERDPLLLFQLRGLERNELFDFLRGGTTAPAPVEPEPEDTFEEETAPIRLQPLPSDPEEYWATPPLPAQSPEAGERRMLDEDIFEKLGPAPFTHWHGAEPQFHRVYDAVYEMAAILLKQ